MHKVVVDRSLVRWQRVVLVLGVLVAAWGPAHSAEVASTDHGVESLAHPHSASTHGAVDAAPDEQEPLGVFRVPHREPGGHDDHRCGHRDVERDGTQATSMRLTQPDAVGGLPVVAPVGEESRPVTVDLGGPRAPPGQVRLVMVCVRRQ